MNAADHENARGVALFLVFVAVKYSRSIISRPRLDLTLTASNFAATQGFNLICRIDNVTTLHHDCMCVSVVASMGAANACSVQQSKLMKLSRFVVFCGIGVCFIVDLMSWRCLATRG